MVTRTKYYSPGSARRRLPYQRNGEDGGSRTFLLSHKHFLQKWVGLLWQVRTYGLTYHTINIYGPRGYWIGSGYHPRGCLLIWKALIHSLPLIRDNLVWRINDGMLGMIGLDPWIGSGGRHILSRELIRLLNDRDIKVFADIADQQRSDIFS